MPNDFFSPQIQTGHSFWKAARFFSSQISTIFMWKNDVKLLISFQVISCRVIGQAEDNVPIVQLYTATFNQEKGQLESILVNKEVWFYLRNCFHLWWLKFQFFFSLLKEEVHYGWNILLQPRLEKKILQKPFEFRTKNPCVKKSMTLNSFRSTELTKKP